MIPDVMTQVLATVSLALTFGALLSAQTAQAEPDWTAIEQKLEAVRVAVVARDLNRASNLASELWGFTVGERVKTGPKAADYLREAEQYAREALRSPETLHPGFDSIHDGNMVLGLIAAKNGDIAAAKAYLLTAGKSPGTKITRQFGPNTRLAAELAQRGESATVIEYLESVRKNMTANQQYIDDWIALLKGGRQPDFRRNFAH